MAVKYWELVIDGPKGWDLGFLRGYLAGKGMQGDIVDLEAEGFDCEPYREKIRELLSPEKDTLHAVVPEGAMDGVAEALGESLSAGRPMTLRHQRPLAGASFGFSLRVYSREHGARFLAYFRDLPAGARLVETEPLRERQDPDSKGVELYAPSHDYELTGRGRVEGTFEAVLEAYRFCRKEDLIHQERAEVHAE
jgi:hypothetical protein